MPFVSNGAVFVTGEVPEKDLERLNGSREDYSRYIKILIDLMPLAVMVLSLPLVF